MDQKEIIEVLSSLRLFRGLNDSQIAEIARRVKTITLIHRQRLFVEGEKKTSFYIIASGSIHLASGRDEKKMEIGVIRPGDFFGEEALLEQKPRSATASSINETTLLELEGQQFEWLLKTYPAIKSELEMYVASYKLSRKKNFEWIGRDEVVHMIAKKHFFVLISSLIFPITLALVSGILLFWGSIQVKILVEFLAMAVLGIAVLWGIWKWIDWGNDYYIVTDQRVVWLEQIPFIYESRQEAPLNAVLSVNQSTNWVQRLIRFGDVIVRTYTGSIIMRNVDYPGQFTAVVEDYWLRSKKRSEELLSRQMRQYIRERFIGEVPEPTAEEPDQTEDPLPVKKNGILHKFTSLLKTRYEEDGVITYRKHWFLLFRRIWIVLLGFVGLLLVLGMSIFKIVTFLSPVDTLLLMAVFFLVSSPWWGYHLIDWRNDIFQVTDKNIIDVDKKPFGREEKRSAPLENILNTGVEQNLLQRIFNYGDVVINVGNTKFIFDGVFNPSAVQREVFERFNSRRLQLEQERADQERNRIVNWLDIYHQETKDGGYIEGDIPDSF
jgi:hypothetical protein